MNINPNENIKKLELNLIIHIFTILHWAALRLVTMLGTKNTLKEKKKKKIWSLLPEAHTSLVCLSLIKYLLDARCSSKHFINIGNLIGTDVLRPLVRPQGTKHLAEVWTRVTVAGVISSDLGRGEALWSG